jgi:hypothetical protein
MQRMEGGGVRGDWWKDSCEIAAKGRLSRIASLPS